MTAPGARARKAGKVSLVGFVSWWVLRGVLRQIGIDSRSGLRSSKRGSRSWVQRKVPRRLRWVAYGVGVTVRAGYRGSRHAYRTVANGVRNGAREGMARHEEYLELREARREFPKGTTYEQELRQRHRLARRERRDALRAGTVTPREEVVVPVSRSADTDSGPRSYFVKHRGDVYPSNSKVAAEAFAEQLRKAGFSGVTVGSTPRIRDTKPAAMSTSAPNGRTLDLRVNEATMGGEGKGTDTAVKGAVAAPGGGPDRPVGRGRPRGGDDSDLEGPNDRGVALLGGSTGSGNPRNSGVRNNRGAKNMSAPTGDIMTVQGLQQAYERIKVFATQVMDQESAAAATYQQLAASYRSQATALEAAAGQMQSVEMDNETVNDISNTAAALLAAADLAEQNAQRATEMVSASEAVSSTAAASGQRLSKHNAMREAVNSGQTARDTRVYQDQ